MRRPDDNVEDARIASNFRRTIELTESALALRATVARQYDPNCDPMVWVMREIHRAKDLAWQKSAKR